MKHRLMSILLIFIFVFSVFGCSCKKEKEEIEAGKIQIPLIKAYNSADIDGTVTYVYPFNTMISVSYFYNSDKEKISDYVIEEYTRLHTLFDRHYYYFDDEGNLINNLRVINESNGEPIKVDQDLIDIFNIGIQFTKLSKGKFNIAVGNLSSLWDGFIGIGEIDQYVNTESIPLYTYLNGEYQESEDGDYLYNTALKVYVYVGDNRYSFNNNQYILDENGTYVHVSEIEPTTEQLNQAKLCTPTAANIDEYIVVNDEENTITINKMQNCVENITITLGALAKSYATEKVAENDVIKNSHFMLNAGQSTIKILGDNLSRSSGEWNIGITDSYLVYSKNNNFASYLMKLADEVSVSTSSGDEKHYVSGTNYYHHIIDPTTGYPNQNRLAVTVVMENAMYADIITTSLMSMNMNETKQFIKDLENIGITFDLFIQDISCRH